MNVSSPYVISHNLLKGLPFKSSNFDVVYHSQVLEHFSKTEAPKFISECLSIEGGRGFAHCSSRS
jgi:hypothetical protein